MPHIKKNKTKDFKMLKKIIVLAGLILAVPAFAQDAGAVDSVPPKTGTLKFNLRRIGIWPL